MDVRSFVVVVRHTQKNLPMVHAAAGARACPSNGIWRIRDFDFWHEKSISLNVFDCGMDVRSFVVVVRHTQKILPIVHAAAGARACPSNGIWQICDFDFWHEKSI